MRTLFTILLILFMTGCSKPKVKEPSVEKSNQSSSTNGKKEPSCTFSCSLEKYSLQLFGDQSPTYFTVSKDGGAAKTYNLDVNWNNDSRIELKKLADTEDVFAIVHINPEENHYIYHFLNCSTNSKKAETIDNGYEPIKFETLEGKNGEVLKAYDWWDKESGARALAPEIFLVWKDGGFKFEQDQMRSLLPESSEIEESKNSFKAEALQKNSKWPTVEFEDYLLTLIYGGEEKEARAMLNYCWPKNKPGKQGFWNRLQKNLKESRYYAEIQKINHSS